MRGLLVCAGLLAGCAQLFGIDNTKPACGPDEMYCGDACVNILSDRNNCGTCDNKCGGELVCGNGTCGAACPVDQNLCDGACSDPESDAMNCGGCGMACSNGDVCVFGGCEPPCDPGQLMSAITDPWEVKWDAVERTAATLDAAQVICKAFGGRLPTATEMYRVSANQSGAVGMSFNTNYLWSSAADDGLTQATIRLSDGDYSGVAANTMSPYRCVCGGPRPRTFTGNHCNGDPGAACFEVNGYNIDTKNRPALRKSAALQECIADRGHLADAPILIEAIRKGLPGPGVFIATADQSRYDLSQQLKWNGVEMGWEPPGNEQQIDMRTAAPFRCAATKLAQAPNATVVTSPFKPMISKYVGETMDSAPPPTTSLFADAHDACLARGGHLTRSAELAELIAQGLPNGSGDYVWTTDQGGYNTVNFLVEVHRWVAQEPRFSYMYNGAASQSSTWDYKNQSHPYRCIYYPVDPAYVPPTTCEGGCFELAVPGAGGAKMWFDTNDRTAVTAGIAFGTCAGEGGHLASERDMTEAVRKSLPNGTGAMTPPWLWTSDFGQNNLTVVRWTDVDPAFSDLYSTYATWADPSNTYRYRCMWTNELR